VLVDIDNRYSSALAMIGGGILTTVQLLALVQLVSSAVLPAQGTNGWYTLFNTLSNNGTDLSVFAILALIMSILTGASGPAVLVGGSLCLANHLRSGKELVGIGATLGFSDLLLRIPTLLSALGPILWIAWIGLFFTVFANRHIKGPSATYVGEVRRLWANMRHRLISKEKKKRIVRRRRARQAATRMQD
jgi:hypothetical protein